MTIFENAIISLELGLEDFSQGSDSRLLSAVRNLHAGILLLYKTKLASLSPAGSDEVLIKRSIRPEKLATGEIVFVGQGRKTVDVAQIRERFKALGIHTDWKRFDKISRVRNDIEHYSTPLSRDAIRGLITDTFVIVRDFISDELGEDPMAEFEAGAWSILLSVSEVFDKERKECRHLLSTVNWESTELGTAVDELSCCECGSELIVPNGVDRSAGIQCRSCGEVERFEACAVRALAEHLAWQNHRAVKDGGDEVLIMCPFCFQDGYVVEEEACAICGESCAHTCSFCENSIPTCELTDGSRCGYCEHMLTKDE